MYTSSNDNFKDKLVVFLYSPLDGAFQGFVKSVAKGMIKSTKDTSEAKGYSKETAQKEAQKIINITHGGLVPRYATIKVRKK